MAFEQIKFKNCFISLNEIKFTLLKFFRLALEILPFTSSSVLSIIICHQTERKEKLQYITSSYLSRFFTYKQKYNYIKHSSSLFFFFFGYFKGGIHTEVLWRRGELPVQKSLKPRHKSWKLFQPSACAGPSENWRSPKTRKLYSLEI